jgi:predicted PurR-regulated permease PerM
VLRPFFASTIWAAMIVIATWPIMTWLQRRLWGSRAAATAVMTIALLLLLLVPLALVIGTIASNVDILATWSATLQTFTMPPPPHWLIRAPVIGQPIVEGWRRLAASRVADLATTAAPYVAAAAMWVAATLQGFALLTACAQSALAGLGLVLARVPFAPLLTAMSFVLCIAQIRPMLVLAPSVAWLFWTGPSGSATLLLVISVVSSRWTMSSVPS